LLQRIQRYRELHERIGARLELAGTALQQCNRSAVSASLLPA
jgi:hypothetical protein